jgi:hypothetical protein
MEVGEQAAVEYTLRNRLPVAIHLSAKTVTQGDGFSVEDGCNDRSLGPDATCTVRIVFKPTRAGVASVQLILSYANNRVPLPTLQTTVTEKPPTRVHQEDRF